MPHECLADEDDPRPLVGEAGDVVGPGDAGLGHQDAVGRDQRCQPAERPGVDVEGAEVAGVDPDQLRAEVDRALGLGLVVDLDEDRQAELAGLVVEPAERGVVEGGDDQQGEVGSRGPGLEELVGGDDEVLAQERYVDRGADRPEVGQASAEAALLGQDADRRSSPARVGLGQDGGLRDLGELTLARAAALDLRDHADTWCAEAGHRVAWRCRVGQGRTQIGGRGVGLAAGEIDPHARDDVVEH